MSSDEASPEAQAPRNPAAGLAMLKQHLAAASERGQTRVWLTDSALDQVSSLPMTARKAASNAAAAPAAAPAATAPVQAQQSPAIAPAEAKDKPAQLAAIRAEAESCPRCRGLGSLRDTMVFAVGNPDADVVFVGEALATKRRRQREPFVGPAGQLLTKIIQTMGQTRESVYISNIVKFRPARAARTRAPPTASQPSKRWRRRSTT